MSSRDYLYSGSYYSEARHAKRVCLCTVYRNGSYYSETRHAKRVYLCTEYRKTLPSSQEHPIWCLGLPKYNITAQGSTKKVQKQIKNSKYKSRWLNSWPAVDFSNSTPSILVSKSTSSSKKSRNPRKFPYLREMVQAVSEVDSNIAIFAFRNS